jgi:hypothetical protein
MKVFGGFPRSLAVAAVAAVTVVPLAASAAAAAPAAPTAYTVYGSAQPLSWGGSSSLPFADLDVPFVIGKTNNLAFASSYADLANPDETSHTLSGETINGLTCTGYDDKLCKDPFNAVAQVKHQGVDAGHAEQAAWFTGKDGHFPGNIRAMTDCAGNCGAQLVRSVGNAAGPAGAIPGYVSVGASSANHDLTIDDKGRLISSTRSQLDNVSIGPKNEVHFSRLVTTAQAIGAGAENTKDGQADVRITDFVILDNPVELTRAGLRLANGGPSEQEAYDGAKVLLKKLRDRGITLELPDFGAQLAKTPDHVTADAQGLRVRFEQTVGSVQAGLSNPLELGHATAVVVALNIDGKTDVSQDKNGSVKVQTTAPTSPPVSGQPNGRGSAGGQVGAIPKGGGGLPVGPTRGGTTQPSNVGKGTPPTATQGPSNTTTPAPVAGEPTTVQPAQDSQATVDDPVPPPTNPDEAAFRLKDVERTLGLRGAHSVSRAFGAFFGLGLILPLARFLIRRLG